MRLELIKRFTRLRGFRAYPSAPRRQRDRRPIDSVRACISGSHIEVSAMESLDACRRGSASARQSRSAAFTLIELLVVVAIIALLISILLPSLARARDQAKSIKCMSNMRSMGQAMQSFAQSHKGRFQIAASREMRNYILKVIDPNSIYYEYERTAGGTRNLITCDRSARNGIKASARIGLGSALHAVERRNIDMAAQEFEVLVCPSDRWVCRRVYPIRVDVEPAALLRLAVYGYRRRRRRRGGTSEAGGLHRCMSRELVDA